ncbi:hypothetical protein [Marilutibacter spongiae]|uniref:DUF695 domain-containing protein n=1 Tax=Marilutibacter spongiae TaxID=2025720 RepID=A0A7W3TIZ7_9GAMM|nr:hypothetical protein [Lysobacter spongiae]MBB1059217.1 hypothetical protein [Lysobacter spongiae]
MGWWSRWFGKRGTAENGEHAVIVSFQYGSPDTGPLAELGEQLRAALGDSGDGEYDGHEIAEDGSDGTFFMYGPDADRILARVKPLLQSHGQLSRLTARLRYGEAGRNAPETVLELG